MSLERHWHRVTPVTAALLPISLLFRGVTAVRRALYALGALRVERLAVPVIVVGNIYVGGTGKTPLVLWLAAFLLAHGRHPGIVSRGYGGSSNDVREVHRRSDAASVGDEPLLLARRSGCPVWVGRDRVAAARELLTAHPECDVVISDDGLQHYRLGRDVEIAVIDGERGLGNGFVLPAGPLREAQSRLESVDAVVVNGALEHGHPATSLALRSGRTVSGMRLAGARFQNLKAAARVVGPEHFHGKRVYAVAGIGHPPRFFAHLERLGIAFEARAFPDHYAYTARDLAFADADAVLMTEKDAVKCAAFASDTHWMLPVDAQLAPELGELVLHKLNFTPST